jgi:hypothetical protein
VHYYIGIINEHVGRRAPAVAAYQEAVTMLDPRSGAGRDARVRLNELRASLPPSAPLEKRVGGAGPFMWSPLERDFLDWLRTHGYQLWPPTYAPSAPVFGAYGTLIMVYRGHEQIYAQPDDLRAWVTQGGRLLLVCGLSTGYELTEMVTSRATIDHTLNWVLEQFGMLMNPAGAWARASSGTVNPTSHGLVRG